MDWISALLDRLKELWPFVRIEPWGRGIRISYRPTYFIPHWKKPFYKRFEARTIITPLGPGIHRQIWWIEDISEESVVQQVFDLPNQSLTTEDDVTVTFSANITYQIVDVLLNMTEVHNFVESLKGVSMMHLSSRVREMKWPELLLEQKKLEKSLKDTLTTRVKKWGVEIVDVGFTDMVRGKVYRFYGDPKSGTLPL